jgi:hypothetical protein
MRIPYALVLLPALAHAGPTKRATVGKYELVVVEPGGLEVRSGGARAQLTHAFQITKLRAGTDRVDVDVEDSSCEMTHHYTWTFAQLDAKLANTTAYALHRKHDYAAAATGFARAAALDPAWRIPAYNLASAKQLLGDKPGAVAALAPWLASEPIATYVQVTTDPELAPLLERPELRALRAATAGTVEVTSAGIAGVAYEPKRGLLALSRDERSWGAMSFTRVVEIYDLAGKLVATAPIVGWDDSEPMCTTRDCLDKRKRAGVDRRAAQLQTMLRELGFAAAKSEAGSEVVRTAEGKTKTTLARAKLGVVVYNDTARVLRGNTELATARVLEQLQRAVYLDELGLLVLWTLRPGAEGCEGSDPTRVDLIKLTAPRR